MKIKPFFTFLFLIFIVFQSCKKDEITDDEYEIINLLRTALAGSTAYFDSIKGKCLGDDIDRLWQGKLIKIK